MKAINFKQGSLLILDLAPSKDLKADQLVFGMGHPGGLRPAYLSPGYHRVEQTQMEMMKGLSEEVEGKIQEKIQTLTPKEKPGIEAMLNRDILNARIHIRPGDSGGPLLNEQGKVVGINDMITSFEMGYFVPSEKIQALYNDEGKFNFKYDNVASPWVQQYKHDWKATPVVAAAETLGVGALGAVGNAGLNRFPKTGGSGMLAVGGLMLASDAGKMLEATDSRDQIKYGAASASDLTAVLGAAASLIPRARLIGKIAMGAGVAGRIGSEFIPNRHVLTDISRKDGSILPPVSPEIEKSLGLGLYKGN